MTFKPIRDQSPTSRRLITDRLQRNLSRRLVADQSPTNRRLVGNHLATYATSSRSKSVAASLLCMFKRQLATDFYWRLVGDLKKTFPRPLQPLRDFSFFLVANQLQTGCRVGVSTPLVKTFISFSKALLTPTLQPVRDLFATDFFATDWRSMRLV